MAERTDEWPRCHTCLYNWCPEKSDECKRCDAVIAIIKDGAHARRAVEDAGRKPRPRA